MKRKGLSSARFQFALGETCVLKLKAPWDPARDAGGFQFALGETCVLKRGAMMFGKFSSVSIRLGRDVRLEDIDINEGEDGQKFQFALGETCVLKLAEVTMAWEAVMEFQFALGETCVLKLQVWRGGGLGGGSFQFALGETCVLKQTNESVRIDLYGEFQFALGETCVLKWMGTLAQPKHSFSFNSPWARRAS